MNISDRERHGFGIGRQAGGGNANTKAPRTIISSIIVIIINNNNYYY